MTTIGTNPDRLLLTRPENTPAHMVSSGGLSRRSVTGPTQGKHCG
jgi:hypothetical protein